MKEWQTEHFGIKGPKKCGQINQQTHREIIKIRKSWVKNYCRSPRWTTFKTIDISYVLSCCMFNFTEPIMSDFSDPLRRTAEVDRLIVPFQMGAFSREQSSFCWMWQKGNGKLILQFLGKFKDFQKHFFGNMKTDKKFHFKPLIW